MLHLLTSENPRLEDYNISNEERELSNKANPDLSENLKTKMLCRSNVLINVLVEMAAETETKIVTLIENENRATDVKNITCRRIRKKGNQKYNEQLSRNFIQSILEVIKEKTK